MDDSSLILLVAAMFCNVFVRIHELESRVRMTDCAFGHELLAQARNGTLVPDFTPHFVFFAAFALILPEKLFTARSRKKPSPHFLATFARSRAFQNYFRAATG